MSWHELRRRVTSVVALTLCGTMAALAVLPLLALLFHVTKLGLSSLDLAFFTQLPRPVDVPGGGLANALVGSLELIGLAALVGVPVGVAGGLFLARSRSRGAWWVRYAADVLNGVPTIVIGVVVYELVVVPMEGFSALSGGVALAVIMLPTVVRTTEEMIRLVPETLYDAALALGMPEWRACVHVLLKGARAGIITGIMLAAARVAGETAPLLFTAFNNQFWSVKLTAPISSLPVQIYNYAISPYEEWHAKAWGASLVLVVLTLVMSLATRLVTRGRHEIIQ
jgi:phosphate transport system permease protein